MALSITTTSVAGDNRTVTVKSPTQAHAPKQSFSTLVMRTNSILKILEPEEEKLEHNRQFRYWLRKSAEFDGKLDRLDNWKNMPVFLSDEEQDAYDEMIVARNQQREAAASASGLEEGEVFGSEEESEVVEEDAKKPRTNSWGFDATTAGAEKGQSKQWGGDFTWESVKARPTL